jgi:hypothetical protein
LLDFALSSTEHFTKTVKRNSQNLSQFFFLFPSITGIIHER